MAWERFIAAFDIHGNEQDPRANKVLFDFMEVWKPKHRICGGDLWNFAALRKGASEEEKRLSLQDDFDAGVTWAHKFRPTAFTEGNHDARLWKLAAHGTGVARDFAVKAIEEVRRDVFEKHKCAVRPYRNRENHYDLGFLRVMHGFGSGIMSPYRMATAYGSLLQGHLHTIDVATQPSLEKRVARVCGCLCKLDMEYAETQIANLRWAHGFPYGVVNSKTGNYHVWQAEDVDGKWFFPEGLREL